MSKKPKFDYENFDVDRFLFYIKEKTRKQKKKNRRKQK